MKKMILFFTIMMVFCFTISTFAADYSTFDLDKIYFDESYYVEPTEVKILCTATLDDDFAPDRVIVMLSHLESLRLMQSDELPDAITDLDLAAVSEKTKSYTQSIRKDYARFVTEYLDAADNSLSSEEKDTFAEQMAKKRVDASYPYYHKVYLLTLNVKNKQAVLDIIKTLEKSNDIYSVEPDYIVCATLDRIIGDADKDGDLTILDATHIQLYKAELIEESEIDLTVSDYDQDGEVTILDATAIQRRLAGLA